MSELPAENIAVLADDTTLILLLPDEHLHEAFIMIRNLLEQGTDVIAATPNAVPLVLKAVKNEEK